jgi:hypothetical protein
MFLIIMHTKRSLFFIRMAAVTLLLSCQSGTNINANQDSMPAPSPDSGIEGIVLIGPLKPEVRDQSPTYAPFAATIVVQDDNRHNLVTVRSGQDGTFRIPLLPGNYWLNPISPNPGVPPIAHPFKVTVEVHHFTHVKIHYDTGLR